MIDVAELSSRRRSAANIPENAFGGGHRLERTEEWCGEGKNKRRKRYDCAYCPFLDDLGNRNHRSVVTFCPACNVALHDKCFAAYHVDQGYQLVNTFGAVPAKLTSGRKKRSFET